MDTRRRISFNMNAGGGQPSEPSTGGTYTVNLNNAWQLSTAITNPDSTLYDGVYQSYANKGVHNSGDIMYIDIEGLESFKLYIRSYAESSWDYIMVSQLDKTLTYNSSYSDTSLVKAHTRGNQNSGTSINNYTLVEFTGIDGGKHRISIIYRKDSSSNSGDDRGYVLIPKSNGSSGSGSGGDDEGGSSEGPINTDNYLTILALENGLTASLSTNACQYCIDGDGNWIDLPAGTTTQSINSGQTLSFKGNLRPKTNSGIGTFTISKKCNLKGNCMSLLFGDDAVNNNSLSRKNYAFYNLFSGCTSIVQVSESFLPATTLIDYCYYEMFKGCTSLTTAPELPATTLATFCYMYMFYGCSGLTQAPELPATTLAGRCYFCMFGVCTSLTSAPELPATTLVSECYDSMFKACTSLTVAPELPATTLDSYCYSSMFQGCSSLTTAPSILPATTLAKSCYYEMFYGCSSLTTAPELPATTLAINCYSYMFENCIGLTAAPELPATTLAGSCYSHMFNGCTSLTVAPELPATTLDSYCYMYMFNGCTSLTVAPELPATTLAYSCYNCMFYGCRKLNYIKMLATDISASSCLSNWVYRVSSTGTFVKNPAMTSLPTGQNGIPSGWTVVNDLTYSIIYTSSDGNIVTPYDTNAFGANIISNTYTDGMGVITFDGEVTTISEDSFSACSNLTSITIPDSVTTIEWGAFRGSDNLTSVTIGDSVTTIGEWAFFGCFSLTSVTIPNSVTTIGDEAFRACSSLTSVTIGDSITSIADMAFYYCKSLTSVYCKATTPPALGGDVFYSNGSGRKIYVPTGSVNAYKSATNWSEYADAIEGYDFGDGGGNLITFTVNGVEYQAEEGMTWKEFMRSEYNDGKFTTRNNVVYYNSIQLTISGGFLRDEWSIDNSGVYYTMSGGAD